MAEIETIKIEKANHAGYAIINKKDFDKRKHVPYVEKPAELLKDANLDKAKK